MRRQAKDDEPNADLLQETEGPRPQQLLEAGASGSGGFLCLHREGKAVVGALTDATNRFEE